MRNLGQSGLNILFLLKQVNCNDGIASFCQVLAQGLSSKDARVFMVSGRVVVRPGTEIRREALRSSVSHWRCFRRLRSLPSPSELRQVSKLVRENGVSVINVHGLGMLAWGKILAWSTGARLVATYHPSVPSPIRSFQAAIKPFSYIQRAFLKAFAPEKLIVLSDESRRFLAEQCPAISNRIVQITGGVDTHHFRPPDEAERRAARARFGLNERDIVCATVGRLTWNKGQDLVISAVRKIRESHPQLAIKCFFVGVGNMEDELKRFAFVDQEDRETFFFLGFLDDTRNLLWAADIFLLPSRLEGFALVVAEAMSAGLVPIRTASGGASDQIIEGKTGFTIPFEDVSALCAAILALTNPGERGTMARAAVQHAQARFSRETMVEKTLQLYSELPD